MIRRLLKGAFALAAAAVLAVVGLLTFMWAEHGRALTLPTPSGPFAVSRLMEVWTDDQRADPLQEDPGRRTELVVWIWHPATRSANQPPLDYLPADWRRELARRQGTLLSTFLTHDLSVVSPHSTPDGTLPVAPSQFPVVILRAGLGALTTAYTTLAEDLASHGYIVVGFDAPYRTAIVVFPDGRVVTRPSHLDPEGQTAQAQARLVTRLLTAWVSDVGFVIDRLQHLNPSTSTGTATPASTSQRLAGRLDMQKIAVVGHSLGGATAAQFCQADARCAAGIDMDGALYDRVIRDGLQRPFMFLNSDHGESQDPADRRIAAEMQSVYDRLPADSRAALSIRGANHFSFTDQLLLRSQVVRSLMRLRLEPRRGLAIAADSVRRFLDVRFKGAPAQSLQTLLDTYPELRAGL